MIITGKQYDNRYTSGQEAVNRGEWRVAYDCFMDCLEYLKYNEPWRDSEMSELERLTQYCNSMF
jgi:hypothetical protein